MPDPKLHAYHTHDGRFLKMVAAPNLTAAARLLHTTVGDIRAYGGRLDDASPSTRVALSEPGRVFKKDMRPQGPQSWLYADDGTAVEPPPPDPIRATAERIARELFKDVTGRHAGRLVMEFGEHSDETGWSERAAADRVEAILREEAGRGPASTERER